MIPVPSQNRVNRLPLHKIELVLGEFRRLKAEMTLSEMMSLLHVAQHEGCSQGEVGETLGLSATGISRAMSSVGDEPYMSNAKLNNGLSLVTFASPAENRRIKQCYLTSKGKSVIRSLESYVD